MVICKNGFSNRPMANISDIRLFACGLAGVFFSLMNRLIAPRPSALAKALEREPTPVIAAHDKFFAALNSPVGCALLFILFASLAVLRRRDNSAWFHACFAGISLGWAVFR
jgi:hypothetical protein